MMDEREKHRSSFPALLEGKVSFLLGQNENVAQSDMTSLQRRHHTEGWSGMLRTRFVGFKQVIYTPPPPPQNLNKIMKICSLK